MPVFQMRGLLHILRSICSLALVLGLIGISFALPASHPGAEYKLKAALIYKLTKFIEWPNLQPGHRPEHFGICLLGEDVFGITLDVLETRKVKDIPIQVYRLSQSEAIGQNCHIVYISESKKVFLTTILQSLAGAPILTLSDIEGFADQGGILQFTNIDKRIGFLINQQSAKMSHLTIAAPLLDLATVVDSKPPERK
jgi:hypothetical protein